MEPSHSVFGDVGQLAQQTGWSVRYILNGVNVVQLALMTADAPRYIPPKKADARSLAKAVPDGEKKPSSWDEFRKQAGI